MTTKAYLHYRTPDANGTMAMRCESAAREAVAVNPHVLDATTADGVPILAYRGWPVLSEDASEARAMRLAAEASEADARIADAMMED